jgi:putative ABC transport system permease protein
MGLAPFAASDVLRNRRRTISSILGVLLAVTFVAGTFIAIDSSARATLDATLAGIQGDFRYFYNSPNSNLSYTELEAALLEVGGVVDASAYVNVPIQFIDNGTSRSNGGRETYVTAYAIDPAHPPALTKDMTFTGSLDQPRTIGLSREVADSLGVRMGGLVRVLAPYNATFSWTANMTVGALLDRSTPSPYGCFPYPCFGPGVVVVHLRDKGWLYTQLHVGQIGTAFYGEIWIDRTRFVNPYDLEATTRNLLIIERRLNSIIFPFGYVTNNIGPLLQDFQNRLGVQRVQYLLLSMPVLLLGIYLGVVGVDLSHAERRRELAVLKTRGARPRQLMGLLLLEAMVGGLIATVIGLALGVGLSRFLLGVVNPYDAKPAPYEAFVLSTNTIFTVAILSVVLMASVAYRSAKRTAGLPIVETLRYYAPGETKIRYNPNVDIALISISVLVYVLVAWRRNAPSDLWTFLLGFIPFILLPFVPLLLIVGITRLATRSTGKVYDLFARAAKPFTKNLYYIIRRNLMRNPRRSANVAIIIALGLAFGVFSLTILATNQAHLEREIRMGTGADMAVFLAGPPSIQPPGILANLSAIPGVSGATPITTLGLTAQYGYPVVYALDPNAYFAVAQPEDWYFESGNRGTGLAVLQQKGQVLVSKSYADQLALFIGDRIPLSATLSWNGSVRGTVRDNVTVGGIVTRLPGMSYSGVYYSPPRIGPFDPGHAIWGSAETLALFLGSNASRNVGTIDRYLVDLGPGADWRSAKATALRVPFVSRVEVTQELVEAQTQNPFARAFYGFLAMEIAFIVIILTAGVGLILYAASLERDVEFAAIIARGSSAWQTAKLLVGEAFVIMLVGLTIGVGVGAGTGFLASQWLATGPTGTLTSPVPYFFVFPWEAVLLVILGPASMLLSAFAVSTRTAHLNVAKVLKMRGG